MKKRTRQILDILDEQYGTEYRCYLNYETPWQLLIATMLSAQTYSRKVDSRVLNILAGIAQSAHKFSNDIRLLQHLPAQT